MRLIFFYISITIFISCLLSCNHSSPTPGKIMLRHVDSLLEYAPDTALSILRSLPVEDYPEDEQVLHGLLLTSAIDKNFLQLLPCDSLIDAALDYYDEGDGFDRARALLYKERIQFEMNMPEEAMANCFEALSEIDNRNSREIKLKSMIYDDLGNWYLEQMLDEKALQMFRLSYYNDSLINDVKGMAYPLRNIAVIYNIMDKQDSTVILLKEALNKSLESNDSMFVSSIYRDLSDNSKNIDTALIYARKAISNLPSYASNTDSSSILYSLGEIFRDIQSLDSAEFYFKKVLKLGDIKRIALAYLSMAELKSEKGDFQASSDFYSSYVDFIDTIFSSNQASNIERLAYKYEAKADILEKEKQIQQSIFFIILLCIAVVLISVTIFQILLRKRKIAQLTHEKEVIRLNNELIIMQSNIERTKTEIEVLRQIQSDNEDEIREKEELVSKMIEEKAELRNFMFSKTPIYHLIQKLSKQDRGDIKNIRVLNLKEQDTLRKTVFEIYSEHINYLRTTYAKMSEDDYLYCCLQLCKFDDYTIAYCFGNTNKQIVVQRRFRLKERMSIK